VEIRFRNADVSCLMPVVRQLQNLEQTQEIRLDDGMPDIGRVIGTWGQVVLRGKEWHTGQVGTSGGIMVWILYEPEGGSGFQSIESWIPFQAKWDFNDKGREGKMILKCLLRSIDARSTSARKLIVRAGLAVTCEALVSSELDIPVPDEVPEDVFIRKKKYPVCLAMEAGEKMFSVEEEISLSASNSEIDRILRYELRPEIIEQKVVSDKAVFRGTAFLHVLCSTVDGGLYSMDHEIPFSQYTELDNEYTENSEVDFSFLVTNLELDKNEDGGLHLLAGITGQFIIADRIWLEIIEDAYSVKRSASVILRKIQLPVILDTQKKTVDFTTAAELPCKQLVDICWYPDQPGIKKTISGTEVELSGLVQALYYDAEGFLRNYTDTVTQTYDLNADRDLDVHAGIRPGARESGTVTREGMQLYMDAVLDVRFDSGFDINPVESIELEQADDKKKNTPSLILRRACGDDLWTIAKNCASSVDAIVETNQLSDESAGNKMLIIPVIH